MLQELDAGGGAELQSPLECNYLQSLGPTFLGCDSIQTKLPWHLEKI